MADGDADLLGGTLNQTLAQWIIDFNMPSAPVPTIWRPRTKNEHAIEELKTRRAERVAKDLENLKTIVAMGFRPEEGVEAQLSEITDKEMVMLTEQEKQTYNAIITAAQAPMQPGSGFGGLNFAAPAQKRKQSHDHGLEDILDQVEDASQPVIDGWLGMINDSLMEAQARGETLEQAGERLLALYPELQTSPFAEVLTSLNALGDLMGREDVEADIRKVEDGI